MKVELKPLSEQVLVITGASSGIGLATARLAAERGARVVLVSRSKRSLRAVERRIRKAGGEAIHVVADVAVPEQVEKVAEEAVRAYGGFDTWVNDAGVSVYGSLAEVPLADARRVFDTNYWGVVHGSLVAAAYLRESGGAIINIGSVLSDVSIPLQGYYSASKHAVKGFTDALRMELENDGAPVSVTLIKPSSINTPYLLHARNYMATEPSLPPPVYSPRTVARAILRCAEKPKREITVGAGGRMLSAMGSVAPRLADRYMEKVAGPQQRRDEPAGRRRDNLYRPPRKEGEEQGDYEGHTMRSSAYTGAALHPVRTAMAVALLGTGVAMALRGRRSDPV